MKIEHWLLPNMQLNSEITDILLSISKNYQFNYIQLDFPTHKNSQKKKGGAQKPTSVEMKEISNKVI